MQPERNKPSTAQRQASQQAGRPPHRAVEHLVAIHEHHAPRLDRLHLRPAGSQGRDGHLRQTTQAPTGTGSGPPAALVPPTSSLLGSGHAARQGAAGCSTHQAGSRARDVSSSLRAVARSRPQGATTTQSGRLSASWRGVITNDLPAPPPSLRGTHASRCRVGKLHSPRLPQQTCSATNQLDPPSKRDEKKGLTWLGSAGATRRPFR